MYTLSSLHASRMLRSRSVLVTMLRDRWYIHATRSIPLAIKVNSFLASKTVKCLPRMMLPTQAFRPSPYEKRSNVFRGRIIKRRLALNTPKRLDVQVSWSLDLASVSLNECKRMLTQGPAYQPGVGGQPIIIVIRFWNEPNIL